MEASHAFYKFTHVKITSHLVKEKSVILSHVTSYATYIIEFYYRSYRVQHMIAFKNRVF